jgi:putative ABC transport system permease protein
MRLAKESWQWFRRDLRRGELTLLLMALLLAVAATTSLRFFSTGLEKRLQQEAARLMAADLVIRSSRPIPAALEQDAGREKLATASVLEFSSVLVNGEQFQLAAVKAASENYPLRGELRLRDGDHEKAVRGIPAPGSIWVDERLLALLKAKTGDRIQLGDSELLISAVLAYEPDQRGFGFSPRALMNLGDVAATHVVQPGSRLRYQLLLSGDDKAIAAFKETAKPKLGLGTRMLDISEDRPEIGTPMARSQAYFSLATIVAVVLAGLAIVTSTRRFAERHYDTLALMRCLGASRRHTLQVLLGEIFWVWLLALLAGAALGALAAFLLSNLLGDLLPGGTPLVALGRPLLTGVATATLTLAGFALPALLSLGRVSPLRVLRREMMPASWSLLAITGCAWLALLLLMMLETGAPVLTLSVMLGGTVLALLSRYGLIYLLQLLRRRFRRPALAAAFRDPASSSIQILGLALGLTALLLVTSLRGELLQAWEKKLPADAPNQFAMNIAADERERFSAFLQENHITTDALYPIVRGRLTSINGKSVQSAVSKEKESDRDESLNRELNLTWSPTLPAGNKLLQGTWWPAEAKPGQVSVEKKLAERLGIKPGDTLRFTLAEGDVDAVVSSVREVDWDSFHPNFYFVFPPGALDAFPASYLTSFHVDNGQRPLLNALVRDFPTIVLIDVDTVMKEVRRILDQVSHAIEAVLVFVLAGGMLVIWSQVMASMDARRFEAALLRVTGISRRDLQWRLLGEFIFLGAVAGVLAAVLNEGIAALVYWQVLELPPVLHPVLWWQAPLAGALLVLLAGLPGARQTWAASPMLVLRRS